MEYLDSTYKEETASFLKLFVLGEKDVYYKTFSESINNLGISHIFAISGMHLGLIVSLLAYLLKKFYISKESNRIIIVLFLIAYNVMTGIKISIIRATLLIMGIYLKEYFNILMTKADLLSFSFLGLLVVNLYYIYNVGFQLSYLIAISVVMGDYLFNNDKGIIRIAKVSIFATVIGLPIILRMNHAIGLVLVFSNVFFILFVTYLFLPLSFMLIILPFLESVYSIVLRVFHFFLTTFDSINIMIEITFSQTIYIVVYWFAIFLFITSNKPKRKTQAYLLVILVFVLNIFAPFKSPTFVRFLDVGQGDAVHIHDHQCDMVIDTGRYDSYDTLVTYFDAHNINDIDIILVSHFHGDHYGEVNDLMKYFEVDTLYLNNTTDKIDYEGKVLKQNDTFSCGNSKFQVLSSNTSSSNENNNSIVLYGIIGNDKYLFTGDIEKEVEKDLIREYLIPVDILKVPHHGSSTSSTHQFIEAINASIGIISVAEFNTYNLPNDDVIDRYLMNGCEIFKTSDLGTISIYYYELFNLRIIEGYKKNKRLVYCL